MKKYLVALSGGADSVALLLWLLNRKEVGAAAHCNFHLRGEESMRDEAFVRELCLRHGVRLFVKDFDTLQEVARSGESIEMVARRLRYEWFAQLIRENHFDGVAVGHHCEDNAETLLLNLTRGCGLRGLTGMQRESHKQGFLIYRPLLNWTKTQILTYLEEKKEAFVTDSTNADTHYQRNLLRHEVLPRLTQINPNAAQSINATAQRLTEAHELYRLGLAQASAQCGLHEVNIMGQTFHAAPWQRVMECPTYHSLLYEWLAPYGFTSMQLGDVEKLGVGGFIETTRGIVTRSSDCICFGPLPKSTPKADTIELSLLEDGGVHTFTHGKAHFSLELLERDAIQSLVGGRNVALIDADQLQGRLCVRAPREGERFQPFGMKGTQLISDFLTNHHRSRIEKILSLLWTDDKGAIWLAGERTDERTRITANTQRVLRITLL